MKTAIIYDKWLGGMGGGEVVACNMALVLQNQGYDVTIFCEKSVSIKKIKDKLQIDLKGINIKEIPSDEKILREKISDKDLFINISFMDYSYGYAKKNIYYVHFPTRERTGLFNYLLLFFEKTDIHHFLPFKLRERVEDRLRAGIYPDMKKRLNSYDVLITHSEYVKKWIKKLWNKDAVVLYPPVSLISARTGAVKEPSDSEGGETASVNGAMAKHNWISSVGRFFTLGHGKKQEILIEAFKLLTEAVKEPSDSEGGETASVNTDLQLHLVGGVGSEPSSLRFIDQLREQAKGYPIFFHYNVDRKEVEEILLKSKIYWHAAGYGEDLEKNPIKFEHFGIAPIEAISAGCIPILFDGGGLTEIVETLKLSKDKHLFKTIEELVGKTLALIKNDKKSLPQSIQQQVIKSFSQERFSTEFNEIIAS